MSAKGKGKGPTVPENLKTPYRTFQQRKFEELLNVFITPRKALTKIYTSEEVSSLSRKRKRWAEYPAGTIVELLQVRDHLVQDITDELLDYEDEAVMRATYLADLEQKSRQKEWELSENRRKLRDTETTFMEFRMPMRSVGLPESAVMEDKQIAGAWDGLTRRVVRWAKVLYHRSGKNKQPNDFTPLVNRKKVVILRHYGKEREMENTYEGEHFLRYIKGVLVDDTGTDYDAFFSDPSIRAEIAAALIMNVLKVEIFDKLRFLLRTKPLVDPWTTTMDVVQYSKDFLSEEEKISQLDPGPDDRGISDMLKYTTHRSRIMMHLMGSSGLPTAFDAYFDQVGVIILNTLAPLIPTQGILDQNKTYEVEHPAPQNPTKDYKPRYYQMRDLFVKPDSLLAKEFYKFVALAGALAIKMRCDCSTFYLDASRCRVALTGVKEGERYIMSGTTMARPAKGVSAMVLVPELVRVTWNEKVLIGEDAEPMEKTKVLSATEVLFSFGSGQFPVYIAGHDRPTGGVLNHHTWAIPNSKQPGDSSEDKKGKAPIAKKHTMHKAAKYEMDADRALEDLLKEYSAMDIDADPDADPKRKKKGIIGKIFG